MDAALSTTAPSIQIGEVSASGVAASPRRKRARPVLLAVPAIVAVALLLIAPLLFTVYASFTSWTGLGAPKWIGSANYLELSQSGDLRAIFTRTAEFVVVCALGTLVFGVLLASTLRGGRRGSTLFTAVWFIPVVTPASAIAVFWANALFPGTGVANVILGDIGLGSNHTWLAGQHVALFAASAIWIWTQSGFVFLISLNAMHGIPVSLYEASIVDGASRLRILRSMTLPLIRPVLAVLLLLEVVYSFNGFVLIWGLTEGGPANATTIVPVAVYTNAFEGLNFGYASAIATVGTVVLGLVSLVLLRATRSASA